MGFFWPFLNPILAILCVKWAKMAPFGGSRGVQNEFFFGPETPSGPNEYRFLKKNLGAKFFFRTPGTPDRKNFRAGPAGSPKVVKIVPLGSLTLLKRSGTLKNNGFEYKHYVEFFCLAKVMPKTLFFGLRWGFLACFGAGWGEPETRGLQNHKNPKFKNISCFESFDQKKTSGFSSILKGLA